MELTVAYQQTSRGWGERIANHIDSFAPDNWSVELVTVQSGLPVIIDEPGAFLPEELPKAELLLALVIDRSFAQLIPALAERTGAASALVPIDGKNWLPKGLKGQIADDLDELGVSVEFPAPFCTLTPGSSDDPLIQEFARSFGRPEFALSAAGESLGRVVVHRQTPCGNAEYIAERLQGTELEGAENRAALLHQYYPCLAGVDYIHLSANITQGVVTRDLKHAVTIESGADQPKSDRCG